MHPIHKLIITGTGRAGTTFLVRLFTELGLDTGYTRDNWQRGYFAHCNAGLEHELAAPDTPYVVKNPNLAETLGQVLADGRIVIDHALIPMRDLEAAALSRIRVGGAHGKVPGGLFGTDDPAQQKSILAEHFHQLVYTLVTHEIPHTFLHFPRFVQDADYAFSRLRPVLADVQRDEFHAAFARIAEPGLVHTFAPGQRVPIGDTRAFEATERSRRRKRRLRRVGSWTAFAAAIALAFAWRWPLSPFGRSVATRAATLQLPTPGSQRAVPDFSTFTPTEKPPGSFVPALSLSPGRIEGWPALSVKSPPAVAEPSPEPGLTLLLGAR